MKVNLLPGETEIDTWTIFYLPPNGGKYNGKLKVTNQRLLYEALFDAGFVSTVTQAFRIRIGSEGFLEIDKKDIEKVDVEKKLLSKKAIVTLTDGSRHTFDYGALNVDKVAEAIQAK